MTDNIRPLIGCKTAVKKPAQKSVTLFYGDRFAVKFSGKGTSLSLSSRDIEDIAKSHGPTLVQDNSLPAEGSPEQREAVIAMLSLDTRTVARIDANARVLGISFASAIAGELTP